MRTHCRRRTREAVTARQQCWSVRVICSECRNRQCLIRQRRDGCIRAEFRPASASPQNYSNETRPLPFFFVLSCLSCFRGNAFGSLSSHTRRSRSAAARSVSSFFAKQNRSTGPPRSWYRNAEQGIEATP